MIIGLFLRHYKLYKGANYVPFTISNLENLNLFIGQNGAGKSSLLEALDTFFNGREFVVHNTEKKSEAFVAPLFLIPLNDLSKFSKDVATVIPFISESFFSVVESQHGNYRFYKKYFDQRKHLTQFKSTHYLISYAVSYEQNDQEFFTFDNLVKRKIIDNTDFKEHKDQHKVFAQLKSDLLSYYSYQYIPVETSIDDFLRLESKGMQDLMSEDVKKRIEKTLNEKLPVDSGGSARQSILDIINGDLDTFVVEVERIIQEIDSEYDFQKEYKAKTRLTANHLTDVVVAAYFSKRNLKKNNKPIKNLSSGERKKALIDIAFAFLTQASGQQKKVILAIDEPESSLHISMCYNQFERLEKLASENNIQLFITTHWYGSLPIINKGNLFHIDASENEAPLVTPFSLSNYFEERGSHPNDVQFKSFFDLSSAIISSLRVQKNNWLIVESEEDKKYIISHLSNTENLKVLPVGGCAIVKLLYDYLYTPIAQKSDAKELQGRIFCLIDTDLQGVNVKNFPDELKNDLLKIRRLQVNNDGEVELDKLDNNTKSPTEIEESLLPNIFYQSLKEAVTEVGDFETLDSFNHFTFDTEAKSSFVKGDDSIIYPNGLSGGNPKIHKERIIKFIDSNKRLICEKYCNQITSASAKPGWIIKLEDFFQKK